MTRADDDYDAGASLALGDREFGLFRRLIRWETGIQISDAKRPFLASRLGERLVELGLPSFGAYYRRVMEDREERERLLGRFSPSKTELRPPAQFDFLERVVLPEWKASAPRRRPVRVWSAGCCTGQEAYTLASVLLTHLPPEAATGIEVLGTDTSAAMLDRARDGVWPVEESAEIPARLLGHFLKGHGSQEGYFKAGPDLRRHVGFAPGNLLDERSWPAGSFDLIFCRNVLVDVDASTKARLLHGLLERLELDGYLFLGHVDSLNLLVHRARSGGPAVYPCPDGGSS